MTLRNLAAFSLAMANGSHRAPGTTGKQERTAHVSVFNGGAAFTAGPDVRIAVTKLCGVRRIKTGSITRLLDEIHVSKKEQSLLRREAKRLEGIEEQKRKDATKGVKFNTAMEETLAQDEEALDAHMEMLGHGKGKCSPNADRKTLYILTHPLQPLCI